jgi:hypothetical protein
MSFTLKITARVKIYILVKFVLRDQFLINLKLNIMTN